MLPSGYQAYGAINEFWNGTPPGKNSSYHPLIEVVR
jgi:hypothetical protein